VALVIANAGEISGKLQFAPDAKMDDGLLDVCVLRRFYFRDALRMGWQTLFGDIRADRAVEFYQAKRAEITSNPPLDLQIDGEEVEERTPLVAEVRPGALRVRVPLAVPLPDVEAKEKES
jgi:diacylglycerol kinase family enzyme